MSDVVFFFFFKKKAAYWMHTRDWSSAVCSFARKKRQPSGGLVIGVELVVFSFMIVGSVGGCLEGWLY